MDIICSPRGIVNQIRPKQGVADISADFSEICLDLRLFQSHDEWTIYADRFIEACCDKKVKLPMAYTPYLNADDDKFRDIVEKCIGICRKADCRYLVVSPVYEKKPQAPDMRLFTEIAALAQEGNITILFENQCYNNHGHKMRGFCSDAYEAAEWLDDLNKAAGEERFGLCMNTGTCNLCATDMHEFAATLSKRIKAVILRDCDGHNDASLPPFFTRNTDWLGFVRGMREIGFDGMLVSDIADSAEAFPPLLKPQIIHIAKLTAEYMKWQIGIEAALKKYKSIVLFGAGNMCRNYMKCYGEKFPPLFTCDNNSRLWGTEFCGLTVRSPEALLTLPEESGIFICNTYYREIEAQLRELGVQNNIEFFNDEYMPSYYFDRIERL